MNCFLIDYENQSGYALSGISLLNLKKQDELIFFYKECVSRISMELHKELEEMSVKKTYILIEQCGDNALDFQLVSYLGACINDNPDKKYYIVSKDRGYDSVCRFWKNKNIFVKRIDKICFCEI